jgi:hypothetical protein
LAPGQGFWATPVVPEVTGADNVIEERADNVVDERVEEIEDEMADEVEDGPVVLDISIVKLGWVETRVDGDDVDVVVAARIGDPVL